MKLVVGLGNPGQEYIGTRHNVGFMVLDDLATILEAKYCTTSKWEAEIFESTLEGERVIFMKPHTFMNLSGVPVSQVANYYKLEPKDIWVVSDDLDLPLGRVRVREAGTSGGHNGLKSVATSLGTEDYFRIRVGVNSPERSDSGEPEASIFVLQPFEARNAALLEKVRAATVETIIRSLKAKNLLSHTFTIDAAP